MDPDYGLDDDGPFFPWLPPEDRLWRHPSEVPAGAGGGARKARNLVAHRTWTVAVVAGAIGALAASSIGMASGAFRRPAVLDRAVKTTSAVTVAAPTPQAAPWTAVDNRTAPSVVGLAVQGPSGEKTGSGVLLFGGYVITDRSLVTLSGAATDGCCISVTFVNGQHMAGRLVGQDPLTGLALIATAGAPALYPSIGTVANLHATEPVIAVPARTSSPFAVLTGTVSGVSVSVDLSEGTDIDNLLAVSPALPDATTGAPLVDRSGRVVGITVALDPMDGSVQNLTFAVPIDEAVYIAHELASGQSVLHPWVGVADISDVPTSVAKTLGLAGGVTAGSVTPGSPASQAGLHPSDIIYAFDGQTVLTAGTLTAKLAQCQPYRVTTISFIHDYKRQTRELVVRNEPDDA